MAEPLNLFPQRAAIGRVDASGNVYMSPEFQRALAALLVRVGGPIGADLGELAVELATQANAGGLALARGLAHLEHQLAQAEALTARLAELRKQVAALEAQLVQVAPPTDWEHPGKIGAAAANSGAFTTLKATGKTDLTPTGAALLTIKPAAVGQVDNVELGKTAPAAARVTTLNKLTFTQPAAGATLTIADGKTLSVANYMELRSVDGAVLNFGMGGTLGSAAYKAEGDAWAMGKFGCNGKAAQAAAASGGTLAGVIAALVANGILSS